MSDIAIKVEGLGKRYKIGKLQRRHDTLRDRIAGARVFNLFKRRNGHSDNGKAHHSSLITHDSDLLWALKNVSFEVKRGEVVGIIGRNGAGKSTLLKTLSRITEPTEGYADINGRVGSLLEVGTGFHSELTGCENIYLNGAVLGMKKAEIESKFDEIVSFAEVEKFIDTPVKRYSSGMYLRLAFAVAAHLEPEILLIDEVLAVGDATFQKKCLGKISEVAEQGRTVLFVSHNMAAIRSLCNKGLVIRQGELSFIGEVGEAIYRYNQSIANERSQKSERQIEFTNIYLRPSRTIHPSEAFDASCKLSLQLDLPSFRLFCLITDGDGDVVVHARTDSTELQCVIGSGQYEIEARFPTLWLRPGAYSVNFKLMAATVDVGKGRYLSDTVMLDVSADVASEMLLGSLTPSVGWVVSRDDGRCADLQAISMTKEL